MQKYKHDTQGKPCIKIVPQCATTTNNKSNMINNASISCDNAKFKHSELMQIKTQHVKTQYHTQN